MIDFFHKGGVLMWPILCCSVVALALIVAKGFQFRGVLRRISPSIDLVIREKPGEIAPVIDGIQRGLDDKQVAFIGTKQIRSLEKGLGVISLISVIAPLLGFTGTVTGMISAFMTIASHGGSRVDPSMVAGGIYEALITTAGGLFVAIPSHIALHFLEDRLDEIAVRMKDVAMALCERRANGI
ncbi:MAG TPA: MotA/TolQ/ExbB proton channel family protein [Syntrophobacteraceae bacterium]|nr:MotA/TolQ/ExbB proton channel family protein [Syntrophobacteraceae bacterium]